MYQISEAAALSGLTVRALRHYDAIALLQPATRSDAGYRLYGNDDVEDLRRIRRYQGFGFALDEIGELLAALLVEALVLTRPSHKTKSMDADAVKLAALIHHCRNDNANVADLCQRFLDQDPNPDDRAFAAINQVNALTVLGRHEDAVATHRAHIEHVMENQPAKEWADTMDISSTGGSWRATDSARRMGAAVPLRQFDIRPLNSAPQSGPGSGA